MRDDGATKLVFKWHQIRIWIHSDMSKTREEEKVADFLTEKDAFEFLRLGLTVVGQRARVEPAKDTGPREKPQPDARQGRTLPPEQPRLSAEPPRLAKVFIGNLPFRLPRTVLFGLMNPAPLALFKPLDKGYAFAKFASREDAERAIRNGIQLRFGQATMDFAKDQNFVERFPLPQERISSQEETSRDSLADAADAEEPFRPFRSFRPRRSFPKRQFRGRQQQGGRRD
jgi:hypothetical protein